MSEGEGRLGGEKLETDEATQSTYLSGQSHAE